MSNSRIDILWQLVIESKNSHYFSSTQCFCGNRRQKPNADDLRPETECNSKCSGNKTQICGGDWRNSIYKIELPGNKQIIID